MKEILETIIRNLVSNPNEISVNEIEGEKAIIFEVKVAESDMGKIIGKEGRVAKAIRTVVKAVASKEGKRVTIEFIG
ncbi:MAG: KH domain-containing protein [Clostridia bacterium]|nr:KH domain-containing protein [Clostridia bacterium]